MAAVLKKLHQIAVHSSDLDRSIAFYRDQLGAQLIAKFDPPGLAFFGFGETRLLLEKNAPKATLYFWVDDIAAAADALRAKGIKLDTEPRVIHRDAEGLFGPAGAEEWMAFFRDPDDNVLAIATQIHKTA
ncbi:MAG TPA: VOC family protein [Polyangia bacterium]|jgi:methylmalonyl-CoA/ethylmalonyl-CoA epimerase|nr:VOC family protein [Polyangia bacterium]